MFAKLAIRNIRRQIGNYLIYFITVTLMVALMFAINNLSYSDEIRAMADMNELESILITNTVITAIASSFIFGYAASFMLKLRRREFGVYLTLGMSKKDILKLFICENVLLYIISLITGIIFGLLLYQGLMALLSVLLERTIEVSAYSAYGFAVTIIMVAAMLVLASAASIRYLRKVNISELLKNEKQEKTVRHPRLWCIVAFIALAGLCVSVYEEFRIIEDVFLNGRKANAIVFALPIVGVFMFLLHFSLSKGITGLLLCRKSFAMRGTNTFLLRQLSGRMNVNSMMIGILAVLFSFSIMLANISFCEKASTDEKLEREAPFDILLAINGNESDRLDFTGLENTISEYGAIKDSYSYSVMTNNGRDILMESSLYEKYDGVDEYMTLSTFNSICDIKGYEKLELNDAYQVVISVTGYIINEEGLATKLLRLNGRDYGFGGMSVEYPAFTKNPYCIIVPDEAVSGMECITEYTAYSLEDGSRDGAALSKSLEEKLKTSGENAVGSCTVREYVKEQLNRVSGIMVISILYISIAFVCMALAMLSLKVLSGLQEDRQRYELLRRLGADKSEQERTLFRQTFAFFAMPIMLPLLSSIVFGIFCRQIYIYQGFGSLSEQAMINALSIGFTVTLIYLLYFTISYNIAKRNVLTGWDVFSAV